MSATLKILFIFNENLNDKYSQPREKMNIKKNSNRDQKWGNVVFFYKQKHVLVWIKIAVNVNYVKQ